MKETSELKSKENMMVSYDYGPGSGGNEHFSAPLQGPLGSNFYAAKLVASPRRGRSLRYGSELEILGALRKPLEPDFTHDES